MSESDPRPDIPPPGGVAWLDVSAQTADSWPGRIRTGPIGLQISPLAGARAPYFFKGARLRGARCVWSASTVSGAELSRRARPPGSSPDTAVHLLIRAECAGSVFDPVGQLSRGTLKVLDPGHEIREQFVDGARPRRGRLAPVARAVADLGDDGQRPRPGVDPADGGAGERRRVDRRAQDGVHVVAQAADLGHAGRRRARGHPRHAARLVLAPARDIRARAQVVVVDHAAAVDRVGEVHRERLAEPVPGRLRHHGANDIVRS